MLPTGPVDLLAGLRRSRPTVVHFTRHGNRDGLYFLGADGCPQLVSTAALTDVFEAAGWSVRLVVLNTSHSDALAEVLRAHIDCVIGVQGDIADEAARCFAIGLYGSLAEGESIADAYRQGCAAIDMAKLHDADRLVLKGRNGVDANRLVLVTERPTIAVARAASPGDASDA